MRARKYKGKTWFAFKDKEEFRKYYPDAELKYWKEGETDDWIELDDGGVVKVMKTYSMGHFDNGDPKKDALITICGLLNPNRDNPTDSTFPKTITTFSGYPNRLYRSKAHTRKEPNLEEIAFFYKVFQGTHPTDAYLEAYPKANSRTYAKTAAGILLQTERIQKMAKEHIKNALDKAGVTDEWVIGQYKHIADEENDEEARTRLKALDQLAQMRGMMEQDHRNVNRALVAKRTQLFPEDQMKKIDEISAKFENFDPGNVDGLPDEETEYEDVTDEPEGE